VNRRICLHGTDDNTGIGTHLRNVTRHLRNIDGYGDCVEYITRYLEFDDRVASARASKDSDTHIFFLDEAFAPFYKGTKIIWYVFDLTKIPETEIASLIKNYDEIWVPSEWGRQILLQHAVPFSKIRVMPEGVDAQTHFPDPLSSKEENGRVRLLQIGKFETRKSYYESVMSINKAFGNPENVEYFVKCDWLKGNESLQHGMENLVFGHCRASTYTITGNVSAEEMIRLYRSADAFLFPSKGEGWGLPLLEALACGVPCLATNYSGQSEYLKDVEGLYLSLDFTLSPMNCPDTKNRLPRPENDWGLWAVADQDDFAMKLRQCVEQKTRWKANALAASKIVRELYSWEACARRVHKAICEIDQNKG
jgi:glycosyltransferase involved in cell wall biosynthesis